MSDKCNHVQHGHGNHVHGESCGHKRIRHDNHVGYLHSGCLHCPHGDHLDEHTLGHKIAPCTAGHACESHPADHVHGDSCGHPATPHAGHVDYLVDGHLHHAHEGHCDHHGEVSEVCCEHRDHSSHVHHADCGHVQVLHDGHAGYLHNGHLHCPHEQHVDEHSISVSSLNPAGCVPQGGCHTHSLYCGHPSVPHGDHTDYIVNGFLHHPHQGHCDVHGSVKVVFATHKRHDHIHGNGCGHPQVSHDGHFDYLHEGHLHHSASGNYEEHHLPQSEENPITCTPSHTCTGHAANHVHGAGCGHEMISHGDHFDFIVDGHLHHPHSSHCDHHGSITLLA